jgi:leucyl aminopeptidase
MKYATILAASLASTATALTILRPEQEQAVFGNSLEDEKYLIELNPGETRWVTEDDKWALKRVRILYQGPLYICTFLEYNCIDF